MGELREQEDDDLFYIEDNKLFPLLIEITKKHNDTSKNEERINEQIEWIIQDWEEYPDWRFGQLVFNFQFR